MKKLLIGTLILIPVIILCVETCGCYSSQTGGNVLSSLNVGLFSMVFTSITLRIVNWSVIISIKEAYAILAVVSLIALVSSISLLFIKLNKRYSKISA